jgi:hypothetical protein
MQRRMTRSTAGFNLLTWLEGFDGVADSCSCRVSPGARAGSARLPVNTS